MVNEYCLLQHVFFLRQNLKCRNLHCNNHGINKLQNQEYICQNLYNEIVHPNLSWNIKVVNNAHWSRQLKLWCKNNRKKTAVKLFTTTSMFECKSSVQVYAYVNQCLKIAQVSFFCLLEEVFSALVKNQELNLTGKCYCKSMLLSEHIKFFFYTV